MENDKAVCGRGWGDRCPRSKGPKCSCACGGQNHGNPAARSEAGESKERFGVPIKKDLPDGKGKIIGMRLPNRRTIVYFDGRWLSPLRSLHVINHSPDGFEWGYGGSGPAQLALAICLEILPKDKALETYQEFKRLWIASRPDRNEFELPISKVKGWLEAEAAGLMRTVHDADCPKCKFPETVIIREKATMKAIAEECSKGCGWSRSFEKKS